MAVSSANSRARHGSTQGRSVGDSVDFNLHDLAGIRVVGGLPRDVAAVARQLGAIGGVLSSEPDLTIEFVPRGSNPPELVYVGLNDATFSSNHFMLLSGSEHLKTHIDFEKIGGGLRLTCESGVPSVPLLIPILNLTLLAKGVLPLHGSAFEYKGQGVLVTGWAKGGKTEALLAFMMNGARYIGDEWVYIDQDSRLYGIPEPIRVWDWHFTDLPAFRADLARSHRTRLTTLRTLERVVRSVSTRLPGAGGHLAGRTCALLERQQFVHVPPKELFGSHNCVLTGTLDHVFFVASRAADEVAIEPIDGDELANRMVFSLQYEALDLLSNYLKYRFAFPSNRNALIESSHKRQAEMLLRVFSNRQAHAVWHPFPAPIPALFEAMAPLVC